MDNHDDSISRNVFQSTQGGARHSGPYNILFILTDQERFFQPGELPIGYSLPAHERLIKQGTTFVNHRINSCVHTLALGNLYGPTYSTHQNVRQYQLPLDQQHVTRDSYFG